MQQTFSSILISPVEEQEKDDLLKMYLSVFHDREPLTKWIGLSLDRNREIARSHFSRPGLSPLREGLCWFARAGSLPVGFLVMDHPDAGEAQELPDDLTPQEQARVADAVALLEAVRRPLRDLPVSAGERQVLHVAAVGVVPGYEGRGIARKLLETGLREGVRRGCTCAVSECTGPASRKLHAACGFRLLQSFPVRGLAVGNRRLDAAEDLEIHLMWKDL